MHTMDSEHFFLTEVHTTPRHEVTCMKKRVRERSRLLTQSRVGIRVARRTRRSFYHVKDTMASFTMASMGVSTTVRAVSLDARAPARAFPAHPGRAARVEG